MWPPELAKVARATAASISNTEVAMRTRLLIPMLLVPIVALAANVHFLSGPTLSQVNGALKACGKLAGLGNQDVTIKLTATATVTCTNNGGNIPPGQTQTLSGSVSDLRPENGNVSFCVTTNSIQNPCPDGMKPKAQFSNVELTVIQGGRVVFHQSF
jgi:hypothetical protein